MAIRSNSKDLFLLLGAAASVVSGVLCLKAGLEVGAAATVLVTVLCAIWWITEALPIPVTSLLPFIILPLLGVLDHRVVAGSYGHTLVLLLLGGFMLSTALEKCGVHRRLALGMVRIIGNTSERRIVLGFMIASAVLSMWISNTATTLMLLPVALAVLESADKRMATPLLLGIAYGASIGGLGTPIGTPPNLIFMGVYQETTQTELSFLQWMAIGIPAVIILLPIAWLLLSRSLSRVETFALPTQGAWRTAERRVLLVFACTAVLWVTRSAPFGGWSGVLGVPGVGDSTVALGAVVALFLLKDGSDERLLDWQSAKSIPWGLLLLIAGGLAIAKAFQVSGLSQIIGGALVGTTHWPLAVLILSIAVLVTFLTELTSNTATTALLLPILAATAVAANLDPKLMMVPAVLSASCAFMLPVATIPNAIVFGTDRVPIQEMAREGIVLNILGAVSITALCMLLL